MALDVTSCRDEREKLQWAFRLYDVDSSGSINREEVLAIMGTLEEVSGAHDGSVGHLRNWVRSTLCRVISPSVRDSLDLRHHYLVETDTDHGQEFLTLALIIFNEWHLSFILSYLCTRCTYYYIHSRYSYDRKSGK